MYEGNGDIGKNYDVNQALRTGFSERNLQNQFDMLATSGNGYEGEPLVEVDRMPKWLCNKVPEKPCGHAHRDREKSINIYMHIYMYI